MLRFGLETSCVCTQALKPVDFSITTDLPKDAQAIIIYTVDESSQSNIGTSGCSTEEVNENIFIHIAGRISVIDTGILL